MTRASALIATLAAWLGAAILTTAVVAPAAFAVLPTRAMAGDLVAPVIAAIFWSGLLVGMVVAIAGRSSRTAMVGSVVAAVSCAIAQLIVDPRIHALRASMIQPMETLSVQDPRRAAFGWLHMTSVGLLGMAMLAAAIAMVALFLTQRGQG